MARAEAVRQARRLEVLAQKAAQDAEKEKLEMLRAAARRWQEAQLIRAYLDELQQGAQSSEGGLSDAQIDYLRWGRAKADWLDPLINEPDPILDQVIHVSY